jgi:hypothetical protein
LLVDPVVGCFVFNLERAGTVFRCVYFVSARSFLLKVKG